MQDWTEQIITIALDGPPDRAEIWAEVAGPLALHGAYAGDYWCVTHVPTGILVWWELDPEVARHALRCFLESPIDWSHTDKAVYRRYEPLFKAAIAEHRCWQRRRAFRFNLRFMARSRRRNRPNIRRVQTYRKLVADPNIAPYLLPSMTDAMLDLSDVFRYSRGPRRLWRLRLGIAE